MTVDGTLRKEAAKSFKYSIPLQRDLVLANDGLLGRQVVVVAAGPT